MRGGRRGPAAIFAWPLVIAAVSCGGVVAGLVGEGAWDWLAWLGLAAPVLAAARAR